MRTLDCMSAHYNGAHCGLTDWYPDILKGISEALDQADKWTTGWYSSKKEIASASITSEGNNTLTIMVSVSDDFDTDAYAESSIYRVMPGESKDERLQRIYNLIDEVWDDAEQNRKDNQCYAGFSIIKDNRWIETYLLDVSEWGLEQPSGDSYHEWGWQGEAVIPRKVKDAIEGWVQTYSEDEFEMDGYTVRRWE